MRPTSSALISRWAKPGGHVAVEVPNFRSFHRRTYASDWPFAAAPRARVALHPRRRWPATLRRAGLEPVCVRTRAATSGASTPLDETLGRPRSAPGGVDGWRRPPCWRGGGRPGPLPDRCPAVVAPSRRAGLRRQSTRAWSSSRWPRCAADEPGHLGSPSAAPARHALRPLRPGAGHPRRSTGRAGRARVRHPRLRPRRRPHRLQPPRASRSPYGHGFGETGLAAGGGPTAFRPPLYPLFLGAVYAVTGDSITAARLLQALLGVAAVGLLGVIAWQLWGRRVALIATGASPPSIRPSYSSGTRCSPSRCRSRCSSARSPPLSSTGAPAAAGWRWAARRRRRSSVWPR